MEEKVQILDHGYLAKVEHYGSDQSIIEAARMSTDKGFLGWGPKVIGYSCGKCGPANPIEVVNDGGRQWHGPCSGEGSLYVKEEPGDEKLLKYLYENKHATPFEMAGLIVEVKAPIMVFREWHRHRTQSFNEMSARYIPLPDENYIPTVERLMMGGGSNKQAQGTGKVLTQVRAEAYQRDLRKAYDEAQAYYQWGLDEGVPKELARLTVPVGRYSKMRANANLRNWLAFLTLRMDEKAQWEIRQYANEIGNIISQTFPRTWELFQLGRSK